MRLQKVLVGIFVGMFCLRCCLALFGSVVVVWVVVSRYRTASALLFLVVHGLRVAFSARPRFRMASVLSAGPSTVVVDDDIVPSAVPTAPFRPGSHCSP